MQRMTRFRSGAERGVDLVQGDEGREWRASKREAVSNGFVRIGIGVYPVRDWSANSVLLTSCDLRLNVGDKVSAHCSIPAAGGTLEFDCQAEVVRADWARGQVAFRFHGIGRTARNRIDRHFAAA